MERERSSPELLLGEGVLEVLRGYAVIVGVAVNLLLSSISFILTDDDLASCWDGGGVSKGKFLDLKRDLKIAKLRALTGGQP